MTAHPRHIRVRHLGDVAVVRFDDLESKVRDCDVVDQIGAELFSLPEPGQPCKVLLDFENAPFIPVASFEGKLIALQKRIDKDGGVLKMAGLHGIVMDQFRGNRLANFFRIYESDEEAIEAFGR